MTFCELSRAAGTEPLKWCRRAGSSVAVTMSTALSDLAAVGCLAAGGFGSFQSFDYKPFALSALFALTFIFARYRASDGQQMPPYQLGVVLMLVVVSFALHLVYLPAGLFCFFTLMLCKNELLLPPKRNID